MRAARLAGISDAAMATAASTAATSASVTLRPFACASRSIPPKVDTGAWTANLLESTVDPQAIESLGTRTVEWLSKRTQLHEPYIVLAHIKSAMEAAVRSDCNGFQHTWLPRGSFSQIVDL